MDEPFDIKKLQRKWDLAVQHERGAPPGDLGKVRAPRDVTLAASEELARIRSLIGSSLDGKDLETAGRFAERVEAAVAAITAQEGEPEARAVLDEALFDLEDILEVFTMIKKRVR